MPFGETFQIIGIVIIAMCMALVLSREFHLRNRRPAKLSTTKHLECGLVFLFEDCILVDATSPAHDFIRRRQPGMSERDGLLHLLRPIFPNLANDIANISDRETRSIPSCEDDTLSVVLNRDGGTLRITLENAGHLDTSLRYKALEEEAFSKEVQNHQQICQNAPQLIWQEDTNGTVTWANKAYLRYADLMSPPSSLDVPIWPSRRLFSDVPTIIPSDALPLKIRRSLQLHGEAAEHWFDVTSMPAPDGSVHYAIDANDIMRAEESQKAFISTIANTFAQLSIGLAIFDRKRRLASYNPAFSDLTGLTTQFLIGRPSIEIVLDRMRDLGKLPEPKDYSSFREQFAALEDAAKQGTYVENWELPDGQTYRVTGKPHPDGALAFLFEDITAEVSLTRRFRTELETGQAVIDNIPDAIAVFSPSNALVISNTAYGELWGDDNLPLAINYDLRTALRCWKSGCVSTVVWRGIEVFANTQSEREPWSDNVMLKDGRQASCHVIPLAGGMTMIKFALAGRKAPTLHKLMSADPAIRARKI